MKDKITDQKVCDTKSKLIFEIAQYPTGHSFRWNLISGSKEIIAVSKSFTSAKDCIDNIFVVAKNPKFSDHSKKAFKAEIEKNEKLQ